MRILFPRELGAAALVALAACQPEGLPSEPTGASAEPTLDVAGLPSNSWVNRAPMPTGRQGLATAVAGGLIYAIGGSDGTAKAKVEAYHPSTTTLVAWRTRAPLPSARFLPHGAATIAGKIYVPGGLNAAGNRTRSLFRYTPSTNSWTKLADLPRGGAGGASGAIDGKLYVYVPYGPEGDMKAGLFRYDPATNVWTERAKPPVLQLIPGAGVVDGKLYLAGGTSGTGEALATLTVYDPVADTWSTKQPMPTARRQPAGAALGGRLYVAGGYSSSSATPLGVTEVYNPATNSWSTKASMLTPRFGAAGAAADGGFFVLGGSATIGNPDRRRSEMYVP